MRLSVLSVSQRQPDWIEQAWQHYARRLPPPFTLDLVELAPPRRGKNPDLARLRRQEADTLLARLPNDAYPVALDGRGLAWTTEVLAERLRHWGSLGQTITFIIGGADGLDSAVLNRAHERWSLGPLTLPHGLVRVVVAEQLYRAWSINHHHPYHRA